MLTKRKKHKINTTQTTALGLLKKYKIQEIKAPAISPIIKHPNRLLFTQFKKTYIPLLSILYPVTFTNFWHYRNISTDVTLITLLNYYAGLTRTIIQATHIQIPRIYFNTLTVNHSVIFSKPKRQLFFMLFKEKPIFIFTGGLMRLVMNEKRRCSKRLYKVATSLIKLAVILTNKRNLLTSYYLRLINLGTIRSKIINNLRTAQNFVKLHYIIIVFRRNIGAQKFNTRRSIKKYIRKRFKTRTV